MDQESSGALPHSAQCDGERFLRVWIGVVVDYARQENVDDVRTVRRHCRSAAGAHCVERPCEGICRATAERVGAIKAHSVWPKAIAKTVII